MVCTGAKSEEDSRLAARKYARIVQKLGFPTKFKDFKIQNMVSLKTFRKYRFNSDCFAGWLLWCQVPHQIGRFGFDSLTVLKLWTWIVSWSHLQVNYPTILPLFIYIMLFLLEWSNRELFSWSLSVARSCWLELKWGRRSMKHLTIFIPFWRTSRSSDCYHYNYQYSHQWPPVWWLRVVEADVQMWSKLHHHLILPYVHFCEFLVYVIWNMNVLNWKHVE